MIEQEVFKRRTLNFDALIPFGFVHEKGGYVIERMIYEGMLCRVTVNDDGEVRGKVFDVDLGEEYVNHRNESATGAYVVGVRAAFESFLREIADACCEKKRYIGAQADRIDRIIFETFGVSPEFLWAKFPHFGVYRDPATRKWFAIIMNVDKGKVVPGASGEVEVMNLKLDDRASSYLGEGVYPSYHMDRKNWVSVLLDDTAPDARIVEMLRISYENSDKKKKK